MLQGKKFGTFGGVFTPSILTILGVIMYMRLPWIVGQAGIFLTIGIVLIAHIVSITTGLSVSSIATDKRVKAGGTYFIISRSLGLPIGGTLGIALFFGLSLSVSLYIIGFSESFLGFWGIPVTTDTIRLTGTVAILFVGTLTFISTSMAIKTQYFIMTAIGISLISIIFGKTDFAPTEPLMSPVENMSPLIFLFAIFFPAVTGFEAGVSMSGDLRDPKKSIPIGTISAILVGLIVYIGLTFFFGYRVNSDALINNPNILLDISLFAPLVVAGIWGATLSSAIGSILGAPRILQATSSDRITPKIFAKGYGKTNEPRNALILTFLVAEAGILIGELNLIARIVSMFFITTYGFLNLSSALEIWASTDFRPSFKIPAWISITGSLVCFVLMMELDFLALIGATIIMVAIYLYLKRKELTLESGDTWEGIWSSVLRAGLNRITRIVKQQRNWRPNIILFSGDGLTRPHLLEFGRWLVHKRGILSNFNLIENKKAKHLIPNASLPMKNDNDEFQGIFMRQIEVSDVYEGMDTIAKVYGFAGLEPNSVMLGWGRNSKQPEKFGQLIYKYTQLDYNIFVLDYDHTHGFGTMRTIDLWWRGGSNNVALGLTLLKFLLASPEWDEARARIFIVSEDSSLNNKIYKNMISLLEEHRLEASLQIINNAIERKAIRDIMMVESMESDLVLLGLPEIDPASSESLIESTDLILNHLRTALLIKASSFFKPIDIGIEQKTRRSMDEEPSDKEQSSELPPVDLPAHDVLAARFNQINTRISDIFETYQKSYLLPVHQAHSSLIENISRLIDRSFEEAEEILAYKEHQRGRKAVSRILSNLLFNIKRLMQQYESETVTELKTTLADGLKHLLNNLDQVRQEIPQELIIYYDRAGSDGGKKRPSLLQRLFKRNDQIKVKIKLNAIFLYAQKVMERKVIYEHLENFGIGSYQLISELQKLFNSIVDSVIVYEAELIKGNFNKNIFSGEKQKIQKRHAQVDVIHADNNRKLMNELTSGLHHIMKSFSMDLNYLRANRLLWKKIKIGRKQPVLRDKILEATDYWQNNQRLINNFFLVDLHLKSIKNRIDTILERMLADLMLSIDTNSIGRMEELIDTLSGITEKGQKKLSWSSSADELINPGELFNSLQQDILTALEELPEDIEIMAEESFQKLEQDQFNEVASISVNLRRYTEHLVESEIFEPLQQQINEMSTELQKTNDICQEVVRFVNYNLSVGEETTETVPESLTSVIKSGSERLQTRLTFIHEAQNKLRNDFEKRSRLMFEKMNPVLVSRAVGELKRTIRTKESKKYLGRAKYLVEKSKMLLRNILVQLIYQRSEGVLFAKKFGSRKVYQTNTGHILNTVKHFIPDPSVQSNLPFYYRQLFFGARQLSKEFLIERVFEGEQGSQALHLYRQGFHGALLILGERFAGKSTLSMTIAAKHFDRAKTFHLYPPEGGSIDLQEFKKQLSGAIQAYGNIDDTFNALPQNSVIIIHDMEMWWQRSVNGFKIIDQLTELINKFSSKCFFIINCSPESYRFINRIRPISELFIRALECQPFDAEDIQRAILLRHRSSGLKFRLGNIDEERISNLKMARLFNSYFDISAGNIGFALYYWVSNIQKINQNTLEIRPPVRITEDALQNLQMDWIVWLQQFLLHKKLTPQRLEQISGQTDTVIAEIIHSMKRSGIIVEEHPDILSINPFMQPILVKHLKEMDML